MTTQTVYGHFNGAAKGTSMRFMGTTTDGTEATITSDQTPALDLGVWGDGVTITHAAVSADTFCQYAYIRSKAGLVKSVVPVAQTGKMQSLPALPRPVVLEIGDLLRVMTDA